MLLDDIQTETSHFAVQHLYDNLILRCAVVLRDETPDVPVVLVTKDTNLRIRADAVGIAAEDYDPSPVDVSSLYQGHREVVVNSEQIRMAFREGLVSRLMTLPQMSTFCWSTKRLDYTALADITKLV